MKTLGALFLLSILFSCTNNNAITIGIQPFENMELEKVNLVKEGLEEIYQAEVVVLNSMELPESTFINVKSPRYRADKLIKFLKENKPDSLNFIIGLTSKDISTTKKDAKGNVKMPKSKYEDWGVFGLGYRPGPSCVVSEFRLKNVGKHKLNERLKKITAHEIGHNLGLKHCTSGENCLMKDAVESIKTVDNETFSLCSSCKSELGMNE